MQKPPLDRFIRRGLQDKFGTLQSAAAACGLTYDRLRKILSLNKYSAHDLSLIASALKLETQHLRANYEFEESKKYGDNTVETPRERDSALESLDPLFEDYDGLKRLARKFGPLTPVVSNLYAGWDPRVTMVLFSHPSSYPIEWDIAERNARSSLIEAARKGAHILYVLESSEEYTGAPRTGEDETDRAFERFVSRLSRENGAQEADAFSGLIALIRVPHCPFCVPFQKPTLCFWPEKQELEKNGEGSRAVADLKRVAITTASIPERIESNSVAGVLLVPQQKEFADAMMKYLDDFCAKAALLDTQLEGFRAASFPRLARSEIIARILRML